MLICYGLSANDEKEGVLNLIKSSRSLMRSFSESIKQGAEDTDEYFSFIAHEQDLIKKHFATLIGIERERIKEGLQPDEQKRLPSRPFTRA